VTLDVSRLTVLGGGRRKILTTDRSGRAVDRTTPTAGESAAPEMTMWAIDAIVTQLPASRTYRVMTAVAHYAGLRPSEVVMLRVRSNELPAEGWGRLDVTEADISFRSRQILYMRSRVSCGYK
jgi:hypothetical protein